MIGIWLHNMKYTIDNKMLIDLGFEAQLSQYEGVDIKLMKLDELKEFTSHSENFSVISVEGKVVPVSDVVYDDIGSGYSRYGFLN